MPPRRKTHLPLTEYGPDDPSSFRCDGNPVFSGDGASSEDLVCGRCHRTLFLAMSREDVFTHMAVRGTPWADRHGRRLPMVVECDCGALNRVWPPI